MEGAIAAAVWGRWYQHFAQDSLPSKGGRVEIAAYHAVR